MSLQSIEALRPLVHQTCEAQIVEGGFDHAKIDEQLNILHLEVVDNRSIQGYATGVLCFLQNYLS